MTGQTKSGPSWKNREAGNVPTLGIAQKEASRGLRLNSIAFMGNALEETGYSDTTAHVARAVVASLLRRAQMLQ
jgi:hypothetical protein